jgi:hypothetical protein
MNSVLLSPAAGPAAVNAPAEPPVRVASAELDNGEVAQYQRSLTRTEGLGRSGVAAPTHHFGPSGAWLAYVDIQQPDLQMLDGFQTGRSLSQLRGTVRSAYAIGLFADTERCTERAQRHLAAHGLT